MGVRTMKTLVKVFNWLLMALGVLLSIHALTRQRTGPNLYRAVNHEVTGLDNSTQNSFSYVVFSDPQFGLLNIVDEDGDGTAWANDLTNMRHLASQINSLHPRPSFVFITGDLSNAYPESPRVEIPGRDDHVLNGFKSPYRTPQTVDLLDALTLIDGDIPIMVNAGNHDMMEDPDDLSVGAFEHVWGDSFYTFWSHGRFFISLETQFFRTTKSTKLLNQEMKWLEEVFTNVEVAMPKTVLMHVPLFIDNVNETDSDKGNGQIRRSMKIPTSFNKSSYEDIVIP